MADLVPFTTIGEAIASFSSIAHDALVIPNTTDLDAPKNHESVIASSLPLPLTFRWEALPYEIRGMTFESVITDTSHPSTSFRWRGKLHSLVVALRPLPTSYSQIMELFAKSNRKIAMYDWTSFDITDWNEKELAVLEKVHMELSGFHYRRNDTRFEEEIQFANQFLHATNLREVCLSLDLYNSVSQGDMLTFTTEWPQYLKGCRALQKLTVEIPMLAWMSTTGNRDRNTDKLMSRIHHKVGVHGQFVELLEEEGREEAQGFVWEARNGQLMDWGQDLGWVWKCPKVYISDGLPTDVVEYFYLNWLNGITGLLLRILGRMWRIRVGVMEKSLRPE